MNTAELRAVLEAEGFDPASYNLAGGYSDETYSLEQCDATWCFYYRERGSRSSEKRFASEAAACAHFRDVMRADPTTRSGYRGTYRPPETIPDDPNRRPPTFLTGPTK